MDTDREQRAIALISRAQQILENALMALDESSHKITEDDRQYITSRGMNVLLYSAKILLWEEVDSLGLCGLMKYRNCGLDTAKRIWERKQQVLGY